MTELQKVIENIPGIKHKQILHHYVNYEINSIIFLYDTYYDRITIYSSIFKIVKNERERLSDIWEQLTKEQQTYLAYHLDLFK